LAKRDILSVADFAPGEVEQLVKKTARMKKEAWPQVCKARRSYFFLKSRRYEPG